MQVWRDEHFGHSRRFTRKRSDGEQTVEDTKKCEDERKLVEAICYPDAGDDECRHADRERQALARKIRRDQRVGGRGQRAFADADADAREREFKAALFVPMEGDDDTAYRCEGVVIHTDEVSRVKVQEARDAKRRVLEVLRGTDVTAKLAALDAEGFEFSHEDDRGNKVYSRFGVEVTLFINNRRDAFVPTESTPRPKKARGSELAYKKLNVSPEEREKLREKNRKAEEERIAARKAANVRRAEEQLAKKAQGYKVMAPKVKAEKKQKDDPIFGKKWYSTDLWTDWGMKFIDEAREEKKPFFLYLAYCAPHFPLMAPADEFVADFVGADRALKRLALQRVADVDLWTTPWVRVGDDVADARTRVLSTDLKLPLLVDEDDRPLRWLSDADLRGETVPAAVGGRPVPFTVDEDDVLRDALSDLLQHGVQYAPVTDARGRVTGILSLELITGFLGEQAPGHITEVPPAADRAEV